MRLEAKEPGEMLSSLLEEFTVTFKIYHFNIYWRPAVGKMLGTKGTQWQDRGNSAFQEAPRGTPGSTLNWGTRWGEQSCFPALGLYEIREGRSTYIRHWTLSVITGRGVGTKAPNDQIPFVQCTVWTHTGNTSWRCERWTNVKVSVAKDRDIDYKKNWYFC
jgi:hypothetical protein